MSDTPPILFDVTRMLLRGAGATPTGIDRVSEAYRRWLVSRADLEVVPVCTLGGVVTRLSPALLSRPWSGAAAAARRSDEEWRRLTLALGGRPALLGLRSGDDGGSDRAKWLRYAVAGARVAVNLRPRPVPPRAIYLNVSHYGLEQRGLLSRVAALGARPAVMIHDLIPILHPEYCSPSAAAWHSARIMAILEHQAKVIVNSAATASDLNAFAEAIGHAAPATIVAPLGIETAFHACPPSTGAPEPPARPYFVCVGTLEPRKNLTFLLTLWRRLAETLGEDTPFLVLAGRRGWETEAILDHLDRSPPIRRFVHEVSGLDDGALSMLLSGARALLSASVIEGFDLPVAEALAMATPVIASDIAAHRELAPEAQLLDPLDGPAWFATILAAAKARPAARHRPAPTWAAHFATVEAALGLARSD